jgi:phosphoesterase RecJ-like protein
VSVITETAWERAVELLRDVPAVAFACHLGPDGDALGSMLGVGLGLVSQGTRVAASWGQEPFHVPAPFDRLLPGQELLVAPRSLPEAPVFVAFDTGALDRLGSLASRATAEGVTTIVLDHHRTNDGFAEVDLIDPDVAATAVLGRELLRRLGIGLTKDIATCFYVALLTDTGRFQYRNTTPAVHGLAGELLEAGVEQDHVAEVLYGTRTLGSLRSTATVLAKLAVVEDLSLVWSSISLDEQEAAHANRDDLDGLIDEIRALDTCDAALLLKQAADRTWRGSLRSKGATDVGAVAATFGGGGHTLAAGFTVPAELTEPAAIAALVVERMRAQR